MRKKEACFQEAVVRALRMAGFYVFAVPNGGSRNALEAVNLKRQGVLAGVADLVILLPDGKAVFAELKAPDGTGRQSPAQREFEENVRGLGFEYLLWKGWPQVEDFINGLKKEVDDYFKTGGTD